MIFATTAPSIEGYRISGYKGTVQGPAFEDLLNNTETLGANAVLSLCYNNALSTDTLLHCSALRIECARLIDIARCIHKIEAQVVPQEGGNY